MPRLPRFTLSGVPQHVIQRGNNRDVIFGDDEDRQAFLETVGEPESKGSDSTDLVFPDYLFRPPDAPICRWLRIAFWDGVSRVMPA